MTMRREAGFAMILVIWTLVALTSLATGFGLGVRHEIRLAQDAEQQLQTDAAITAALNYTFLALNRRDTDSRWLPDGSIHEIPWDDNISLRVRVRSESGKIDINRAPRELIEGLLVQTMPEKPVEALVDALFDWRDPDDRPLPQGAEADDYRAAGYAYTPTNQPLQTVYELTQIMGFDASSVEHLLPYITTYSQQPRINAPSASRQTLRAIPGISAADAETFVEARNEVGSDSRKLPYNLLDGGMRYVDMSLQNKTITVDIEIRAGNSPTRVEQIIAQLGPGHYYHAVGSGTPEDRAKLAD